MGLEQGVLVIVISLVHRKYVEFIESRNWVQNNLTFDKNAYVSLFETTIRMLGGLLSAYHLTGDRMFIEKADDLGARLIGAFDSPSPIPYSDVHLRMAKGKQPTWGGDSSLSEVMSCNNIEILTNIFSR